MKKIYKYAAIIAVISIMIFLGLYKGSNIGVLKSYIEKDARRSDHINDDWEVVKATTDSTMAMIFYEEDLSDYRASIYKKHQGISLGYFFWSGGSILAGNDGILKIKVLKDGESVYMSMNKQQVDRIEVDNGQTVEIIKIDSTKPFAIALSDDEGFITIYDKENNIIPIVQDVL